MMRRLLVANRGEIAVRVMRAAAELGIECVAVAPDDDTGGHQRAADTVATLPGRGVAAYLGVDALVAAATEHRCDAVHPGYGFLAESAVFAEAVESAGLVFVGPRPATLRTLGDKASARALATQLGVAVAAGTPRLDGSADLAAFVAANGPTMVKAVAGGGGRGMRRVDPGDDLDAAFERCASEARSAFGDDGLLAEAVVDAARHVEVQVVGDGSGAVVVLGDRDCSLQRRRQKVVEFAPAPLLDPAHRRTMADAARSMAAAVDLRGVATVEFLVGADGPVFCEVNPRIQVEHTVTEEVTGVDLVETQLRIAGGATLAELSLPDEPDPDGVAVQLRVSAEQLDADGVTRPDAGTIERWRLGGGRGVRVDTHVEVGDEIGVAYDPLLAKVIVRAPDLERLRARVDRVLDECDVDGVGTNLGVLRRLWALLPRVAFDDGAVADRASWPTTTFVDEHVADLADPTVASGAGGDAMPSAPGSVVAPVLGTVVSVAVDPGDDVAAGAELVVIEAMKMEHVVTAPGGGRVAAVAVSAGETVRDGQLLVSVVADGSGGENGVAAAAVDLDHVRPDLAESIDRHAFGLDENRPQRVDRRHGTGRRTARENIADLVDPGTFVEYGPLVIAAQRKRRSVEDLIENTPGDGLVGGIAEVNGAEFPDRAQCLVASYDYMVLAGTQGHQNHRKKDRLFEIAHSLRLPVILYAEGGGGRPGDTDGVAVAGLDCLAFQLFAELSGHVPLIGINGGYCFAGNAALLGCCDVVIATEDSNLGMGGPAMIEGGGLGVFHPTEVGPIDVQRSNGVVDIVVADEAEATEVARTYLSYFQGTRTEWEAADQRRLRHVIPENRLRIHDMHDVIDLVFDTGSVLELRADFGLGMITALARIEGRAVGVIGNNPVHLAGAIDADAADKASRFLQLCEAFGLPVVSFCDTPGIMVGPEAEETALVRHAARLFVTGANLTVPMCTVVTRKGYGLGAQAMAGGGFKRPIFTVGWPSSEFGGMGLEGAVRLGYRNELAAIDDPDDRQAAFESMVARMYEVGKGVSMADHFEIDDVIDPADTRRWITTAFRSVPSAGQGGRRPFVDTW